MFIIDLTYLAPLNIVEEYLDEHRNFLTRHYETGTFIASGRKEPRTGGIILARGSKAEIEHLIEDDPFKKNGVAQYSLLEFIPTMTDQKSVSLLEG